MAAAQAEFKANARETRVSQHATVRPTGIRTPAVWSTRFRVPSWDRDNSAVGRGVRPEFVEAQMSSTAQEVTSSTEIDARSGRSGRR